MIYRPFYVVSVVKSIFLEQTKSILKISLGGSLINITLNLIFVPLFGIKAALISTFTSYLYLGFSGFYFSDLKDNIDFKYNPIWFLIIILITLFLSVLILDLNIYIKLILSLIIFIASALAFFFKGKNLIRQLNSENFI
jgi:O-antigen/teichoic acid export membrane protein